MAQQIYPHLKLEVDLSLDHNLAAILSKLLENKNIDQTKVVLDPPVDKRKDEGWLGASAAARDGGRQRQNQLLTHVTKGYDQSGVGATVAAAADGGNIAPDFAHVDLSVEDEEDYQDVGGRKEGLKMKIKGKIRMSSEA